MRADRLNLCNAPSSVASPSLAWPSLAWVAIGAQGWARRGASDPAEKRKHHPWAIFPAVKQGGEACAEPAAGCDLAPAQLLRLYRNRGRR